MSPSQRASIRRSWHWGTFISILLTAEFILFVCNDITILSVQAFSISSVPGSPFRMATVLRKGTLQYGRNMEIWPPVGVNDAIQIQDSFPNGLDVLSFAADSSERKPRGIVQHVRSWWQRRVSDPLRSVDEASTDWLSSMWITVAIWIVTLQTGAVRPIDLSIVAGLTGYFALWQQQWTRSSSTTHLSKRPVPYTVQLPLGYQLTHSRFLRNWKRIGRIVDQVIPFLLLVLVRTTRTFAATKFVLHSFDSWMTRVLFLWSSQTLIEFLSDRTITGVRNIPLPIRGSIQVVCSSVRLVYLWQWLCTVHPLDAFPGALPLLQLVYGFAHLLGFLLPVALVRYMRVHFYMIEAQEVQLRTSCNTVH